MRQMDLPEGFSYKAVPFGISYGRVLSAAELDERHVSFKFLWYNVSVISGKYKYPSGNGCWRVSKGVVR